MDSLLRDCRLAWRRLRQDVFFTVVAGMSIALGVAAVSIAYAVVDAVEFRALPYAAPNQLVVAAVTRGPDGVLCRACGSVALAGAWQHARSFARTAVLEVTGARLYRQYRAERLLSADVSAAFFDVLGVHPLLGRTFSIDEVRAKARLVVLSFGTWRSYFGADAAVIGREVELSAGPGHGMYTVIGVMPRSFRFLDNEVWLPLGEVVADEERRYITLARLREGVSLASAAQEGQLLADRMAAASGAGEDWTGAVVPLRGWLHQARPEVARGRFALLAATCIVLLLAAVNVASLNLARARSRLADASVRSAMGASRARLIQTSLVESLMLFALGGLVAVGLARIAITVVAGALRLSDAGFAANLDIRIVLFAAGTTLLAGSTAGLLPAVYGSRTSFGSIFGQRGGTDTWRGSRAQQALVVVEIACTLALLTAGGMFGRQLWRLRGEGAGFDPSELYLVTLRAPTESEDSHRTFAAGAVSEIGLASHTYEVGVTGQPPRRLPVRLDAPSVPLSRDLSPMVMLADSALFALLGMDASRGRSFRSTDVAGSLPVAVVNAAAVRQLWQGRNPLGERIVLGDSIRESVEVIGVVEDVKLFNAPLDDPMPAIIYRAFDQSPSAFPALLVRAPGARGEVEDALRRLVTRMTNAPSEPSAVVSVEGMHERQVAEQRLHAWSLGTFAGLALFLGAVGIYGIVAYSTVRRKREVGVRIALGATPANVLRILVRDGLALAGLGLAIGLAVSVILVLALRSLLVGETGPEPWMFAGAVAVLSAVLLCAIVLPAWRASRANPASVLRQ